ncbi:hypothetical protein BT93_C0400 [Corymbia citriodora subsp. variegata]|nr:hypothetical protein BT93_C0400 [Corymbia citriodora subsp. variegata]
MPKSCHQTASRRIADKSHIIDPCPEKRSARGLSTVNATSSNVQPLFLEFYVPD